MHLSQRVWYLNLSVTGMSRQGCICHFLRLCWSQWLIVMVDHNGWSQWLITIVDHNVWGTLYLTQKLICGNNAHLTLTRWAIPWPRSGTKKNDILVEKTSHVGQSSLRNTMIGSKSATSIAARSFFCLPSFEEPNSAQGRHVEKTRVVTQGFAHECFILNVSSAKRQSPSFLYANSKPQLQSRPIVENTSKGGHTQDAGTLHSVATSWTHQS